jgi:hypothetical protein
MNIIIKYLIGLFALWQPSLNVEMHDRNNDGIVSSVGGTTNHDYAHSFEIQGRWSAISYTYKRNDPYRVMGDTSGMVRFDVPVTTGETQVVYFVADNTSSHYLYFHRIGGVSVHEGVGIDWNTTSLDPNATATLCLVGIPSGTLFYDNGDTIYKTHPRE